MRIEIDTEEEILTVNGTRISLMVLESLRASNKHWFRIVKEENGSLIVENKIEEKEINERDM